MTDGNNEGSVDAEQLEQELVKQAEERAQHVDPVENAAMAFSFYTPRFKLLSSQLSKRELKRVLWSIVEGPLAMREYKHKTDIEKEVVAIGKVLFDAKMVMIFDVYSKNAEKIREEAEKQKSLSNEAQT